MGLLQRLFGPADRGTAPRLYEGVVAQARRPHWYQAGAVPDTVDGRFDMIAAILSLVILRLEQDPAGATTSASVAECFVEDMDGQLREFGIGDIVVGKHIGRMMSMLGGRIGAYRDGFERGSLATALTRNVYRGDAPDPAAVGHVEGALLAFRATLAATPVETLVAGRLPQ